MAGPTAAVLLRSALTKPGRADLAARIARNATHRDGNDLWFEDRPFVMSLEPDHPDQLTEIVAGGLPRVLGWTPAGVVHLGAMCNDAVDHRLLALSCAALAEDQGGIVDFCGALPIGPNLDGAAFRDPVCVRNPEGLDGTLFAAAYVTVTGSFATAHYGDAALLRSWLRHPAFRMVE